MWQLLFEDGCDETNSVSKTHLKNLGSWWGNILTTGSIFTQQIVTSNSSQKETVSWILGFDIVWFCRWLPIFIFVVDHEDVGHYPEDHDLKSGLDRPCYAKLGWCWCVFRCYVRPVEFKMCEFLGQ